MILIWCDWEGQRKASRFLVLGLCKSRIDYFERNTTFSHASTQRPRQNFDPKHSNRHHDPTPTMDHFEDMIEEDGTIFDSYSLIYSIKMTMRGFCVSFRSRKGVESVWDKTDVQDKSIDGHSSEARFVYHSTTKAHQSIMSPYLEISRGNWKNFASAPTSNDVITPLESIPISILDISMPLWRSSKESFASVKLNPAVDSVIWLYQMNFDRGPQHGEPAIKKIRLTMWGDVPNCTNLRPISIHRPGDTLSNQSFAYRCAHTHVICNDEFLDHGTDIPTSNLQVLPSWRYVKRSIWDPFFFLSLVRCYHGL